MSVKFSSDTITVVKAGDDAKSQTFGELCSLDMSTIEGDISYALANNDTLDFGSTSYSYKRALNAPKTKSGIPERVFSVWGTDDRIVQGVTQSFELEVEPELLTFRLNCNG